MKKVFQMLMVVTAAVATAVSVGFVFTPCAAAATAQDVVSADKEIHAVTNTATVITLSRKYTSKPLSLSIFNAIPTNGTAKIFSTHVLGDQTVATNTLADIDLTALGGSGTTNLNGVFTGYLFPREPLYIKFDVFTNGAFQVIGELYGIGK